MVRETPSSGEVVEPSELVTYYENRAKFITNIWGMVKRPDLRLRRWFERQYRGSSKGSIGVAGMEVQWGGLERRTEYWW